MTQCMTFYEGIIYYLKSFGWKKGQYLKNIHIELMLYTG
jgi:hypothetical protein